jgi:hypothetical protein
MPLANVLYTAKTHTIGRRDGASHGDDGRLAVKLSSPGTPGSRTNPQKPRNRTGVVTARMRCDAFAPTRQHRHNNHRAVRRPLVVSHLTGVSGEETR